MFRLCVFLFHYIHLQNAAQQSSSGVGFDVYRTEDHHPQCSFIFGNYQKTHKYGDQSLELQRSTVENIGQT